MAPHCFSLIECSTVNVPEQYVVNRTSNLSHVDECVCLHVLFSLEVHVAVVTLDFLGTNSTPLHMVYYARSRFAKLETFRALLLLIFAFGVLFLFPPVILSRLETLFDQRLLRMYLFPMLLEVPE